jgi:hypothetical protein
LNAIQAEEDRLFAELAASREATIDPTIVKLYERLRQITKDMSRSHDGMVLDRQEQPGLALQPAGAGQGRP